MDFKKERKSITVAHSILKYAVDHFHAQGYDVNDEWFKNQMAVCGKLIKACADRQLGNANPLIDKIDRDLN